MTRDVRYAQAFPGGQKWQALGRRCDPSLSVLAKGSEHARWAALALFHCCQEIPLNFRDIM